MVVADSSALVEVLIDSPKADRVVAALAAQQTHAPELIGFEVLSAIRGKVRGSDLSAAEGAAAMLRFEEVEERLMLWPLTEQMTELAIARHDLSAYDACYVSLATLMPCPLVTADARLGRAVKDLIDVIVV